MTESASAQCGRQLLPAARRREDRSLILATDGLWDVMQPGDAIAAVKRVLDAGNSSLKAEALGDAATSLANTAAQERSLVAGGD